MQARPEVWRAYSPGRGLVGTPRTDRDVAVSDASIRNQSTATYGGVADWTVQGGVILWHPIEA